VKWYRITYTENKERRGPVALYTIGDLHLSLGSDKPMDIFGDRWQNYVEKIQRGFSAVTENDTTVLCGDLSWGMSMEESLNDLTFIHNLPGRKILMKGNHDYWWNTAAKMQRFFDEHGLRSLEILHNNCLYYNDMWHPRLVLRAGQPGHTQRKNVSAGGRKAGNIPENGWRKL